MKLNVLDCSCCLSYIKSMYGGKTGYKKDYTLDVILHY